MPTRRSSRPSPAYLLALAAMLACAAPALAGPSSASTKSSPRLRIEPARVALRGALGRQQLAATFEDENGTLFDVTRECAWAFDAPGVATIGPGGVARPVHDGRTVLKARVRGVSAAVEVVVERSEARRAASYRTDVAPLISKAGCNMGACHGNLSGKGGFRLSLRGDDPGFDFEMLSRDQFGRRLNRISPRNSLAFLKPTGAVAHGGGLRFPSTSIEAETLARWIASGADDDHASAPKLRALSVFPAERFAAPGALEQQLVVTATFEDGSTRDVTRQATYDVSDPTRVETSIDGLVRMRGPGEAAVAVRFMTGRAVSRLAFPADRPNFVWNAPRAEHPIDRAVFAKLKAMRTLPSPVCEDHVFLRRAYLDAIGRLPTADEARAFLNDPRPDKRDKLADRLVERPEFADFWALKWADLLRNEEKTMGQKGAWVFQRWLRDQLARDLPMDEMVRQIVSGLGSNFQNPPSSFYRTNRDPATAAESVAQVFLGFRLQCARCHNHPFDVWSQDDYYRLAAFFSNIQRKEPHNVRKDDLDKHEINGDEIIYVSARPPRIVQPRTGAVLRPAVLPLDGAATDDAQARSPEGGDAHALDTLADWLTRDNRQFLQNLANRTWFHLLGRGIVEPVDDFRDSNPPSSPALLKTIADYFQEHGTRPKPLVAWILKSRTYQAGAAPLESNRDDEINFARAIVRPLPAEVLLDAISQVLEAPERFRDAPEGAHAAQMPGVKTGGDFLKTFGKPDRLLTCECERSDATTLAQAFQMINGPTVRRKLVAEHNRLGRLIAQGKSDQAVLEELYLAALCRLPRQDEARALLEHVKRAPDRRAGWEDVAWAVLNSKEFLLRR